MDYYLDENDVHRAKATTGMELLASFLEEDIQSSIEGCNIALRYVSDVEEGLRQPFDATGNAHNVFIQPNHVQIEHLWLDPPVPPLELTVNQFRQAILDWRDFLLTTPTN